MGSFTRWRGIAPQQKLSRYTDNFFNTAFRKAWEDDLAIDRGEMTPPAVNVKEDQKGFTLEFAAPGFNKSDFQIEVKDRVLTISAERKEDNRPGAGKSDRESSDDHSHYTRREFFYHAFSRSFTLPDQIDEEDIRARYENGILFITVPAMQMEEPAGSRKITVG